MEAKDIKWCPQHGYPLPCHKCGMPLNPSQQLEVYEAGYNKALGQLAAMTEECKQMGRKEVVEWIKDDPFFCDDVMDSDVLPSEPDRYFIQFSSDNWKKKLKEWGIK